MCGQWFVPEISSLRFAVAAINTIDIQPGDERFATGGDGELTADRAEMFECEMHGLPVRDNIASMGSQIPM